MLDEHYGIVMMFDALSKEPLFPQTRIKGEYDQIQGAPVTAGQDTPVRIPREDSAQTCRGDEEGYFYEGLNPKYRWMLAHKVDGEHPTGYSDLLLVAQKLERWAESRDPLLPKTATAGRLNITHSQTRGNLFPSQKLKGNHTFTAQSATVENNEAKEDSGAKLEGEEEAVSSAGEDEETSSRAGGADQSVRYIVYVANTVKLYQKKNQNCFGCGSPDHLLRDWSKRP